MITIIIFLKGSRSKRCQDTRNTRMSENVSELIDLTLNEELHLENKQQKQRNPPTMQQNRLKQRKIPTNIQSTEILREKPAPENNQLHFECPICNQQYKYEAFLKRHILLHDRKMCEPFPGIKNKGKNVEKSDRTYECYKCRYSAKLSDIQRHMIKCSGPSENQCDICFKSFSTCYVLQHHKARHGEAQYQCDECPKKFCQKIDLGRHKISCHTEASQCKFECFVCRKPFAMKNRLVTHLKTHAKDNLSKCDYCNYTCGAYYITRHVRSGHPDKWIEYSTKSVYECEFCQRKFKQEIRLKDHIKNQHSNGRQFECSVCKKCFKEKKTVMRHELIHGDKNFECSYCDLKFGRHDSKMKHEIKAHEKIRTFECYKCRFSAKLLDVKKHMHKCLGEVKNQCDICQKTFTTNTYLKIHKSIHDEKPVRKEDYKCQFCEKRFWIGGNLIKHIQNIHHRLIQQQNINLIDLLPDELITKERKFQCSFCSKKFFHKRNAQVHERIHTKPSKCQQCDFKCANEQTLFDHIHKEHFIGSKNVNMSQAKSQKRSPGFYECFICHLSYKFRINLKYHMLQHGEKKIQCKICPRKFYTKNRLREHERIHIKPHKCKMCNFRCAIVYSLYVHTRKEHLDKIDPNSSDDPPDAVVKLRFDDRLGVWT